MTFSDPRNGANQAATQAIEWWFNDPHEVQLGTQPIQPNDSMELNGLFYGYVTLRAYKWNQMELLGIKTV